MVRKIRKSIMIALIVSFCSLNVCVMHASAKETDTSQKQKITVKTGWKKEAGKWYYYKKDGTKKTGWLSYKNDWYFLGKDGSMYSRKWKYYQGFWYYFGADGKMCSNTVVEDRGELYYFFRSGQMRDREGWFKFEDRWFFSQADGTLYRDRIICSRGVYYYMQKDGAMRELENQVAAKVAFGLNGDLKEAFRYACGLTYYGRELFDASWGSKRLSEQGINERKGNCFVLAGTFREIAYAMGYDVHQMDGYVLVTSGKAKHSWVEIEIDGEIYCFDVSAARSGNVEANYMFQYGAKGTYKFVDYTRMN